MQTDAQPPLRCCTSVLISRIPLTFPVPSNEIGLTENDGHLEGTSKSLSLARVICRVGLFRSLLPGLDESHCRLLNEAYVRFSIS